MAYLTQIQLENMGFKSIGTNVLISDKASIYNADQIEIGNNSRIDDFCVVSGKVIIGNNVHLAPFCLIAGGKEGILFEDFSGAAYQVQIFTQSDDYSGKTLTNPTIPLEYKLEIRKAVYIKKHVIIGAGSIILPGIVLETGCSVGAMSLVRKSTEPWGVYVGNPAKRLKDRKKDLLILEEQYLAELKND
ncbi:acyltransferase [Wohlfahrtiimonas chitiniclastica]|uniref:acyltransferase n=1 Tax=Wohlfahrtiimonas chitiniclastica TaxID=400946 RepID=UPI000381F4A9|nr:acyltransferase [Wohlfahrtiimonas chitiniclastica]